MKNKAIVLLSTYNGERFLRPLLDSVEAQQKVDFDIYIRDDGSSDSTKEIILEYQRRYSNIRIDFGKNKGYAKSFWTAMQKNPGYKYYAFCDQDDIWNENKLSAAIQMIEDYEDNQIPLLYTSKVVAVDCNLEIVSDNCFNSSGTINVYQSLQRSIIPGCVFVFNDYAWNYLAKYDGYMESHDWAVYSIVSAFGKVLYDSNSYIMYRIHQNNTIGNESKSAAFFTKVKRFFKKRKCTRSNFARDFYQTFKESIKDNEMKTEVYNLAYYIKDMKCRRGLLFSDRFRGFIFKLYVILNRV